MRSTKSKTKLKFDAIGAPWEIEVFDASLPPRTEKAIFGLIERFDKTYSRFRADSWVSQLAAKAGSYPLPSDALRLFAFYKELYDLTDGLVTPLIGQQLAQAGYDAGYSFQPGRLTELPSWEDSLAVTNKQLIVKQPVQLDVGAAGKGYLVDLVAALLERSGIRSFVVDASGDMVVREVPTPQRIGLENPLDTSEVIGYTDLSSGALCASAGNRRHWGKFSHIINPKTKHSPKHLLATWVVADKALLADGLSTALFFCPAEKLQKQYTFEYAVVDASGLLQASSNFPATFFR